MWFSVPWILLLFSVARILLFIFFGTDLIVRILWHESYWQPNSQAASQPASVAQVASDLVGVCCCYVFDVLASFNFVVSGSCLRSLKSWRIWAYTCAQPSQTRLDPKHDFFTTSCCHIFEMVHAFFRLLGSRRRLHVAVHVMGRRPQLPDFCNESQIVFSINKQI